MTTSQDDRRLAERHNIGVSLKYRLWRAGVSEQHGRSLNISEGGVYFATRASVTKGEIVEVRLKMPEAVTNEPASEWLCPGQVVRVDHFGKINGVGVRFDCYEVAKALGTTTTHWHGSQFLRSDCQPV